jgi:hypothetical protein
MVAHRRLEPQRFSVDAVVEGRDGMTVAAQDDEGVAMDQLEAPAVVCQALALIGDHRPVRSEGVSSRETL